MNFIASASLGLLNLFFFVLSPIIQANLNEAELSAVHIIVLALMTVFFVVGAAAHMKILTECPKLTRTDWQMLVHGASAGASIPLLAIAWLRSRGYMYSHEAEVANSYPIMLCLLAALMQAGFVIRDILIVAKGVQAVERAAAAESDVIERELGRACGKVRSSAGILESVSRKFGTEREEEAKAFARRLVATYVEQFESDQLTNESTRIVFKSAIDFAVVFRAEKILLERGWRLSMIDQQSFILAPCVPDYDRFGGGLSF